MGFAKVNVTNQYLDIYPMGYTYQRNCFYSKGHYFVLFASRYPDYDLLYASSPDGQIWDIPVSGNPIVAYGTTGGWFALWYESDTVYLIYEDAPNTYPNSLKFIKGTVNNGGTITWGSPVAVWTGTGTEMCIAGNICKVSGGRLFALFTYRSNGASSDTSRAYCAYSDDEGATWSTPTMISPDAKWYGRLIVPLTSSYVFIGYDNTYDAKGKYWDGTTLGSEEVLYDSPLYRIDQWRLVQTQDGRVHMLYTTSKDDKIIYHRIRSSGTGGTWSGTASSATAVVTMTSNNDDFSITRDGNDIYCYYIDEKTTNKRKLYYKKFDADWDGGTWMDEVDVGYVQDYGWLHTTGYVDNGEDVWANYDSLRTNYSRDQENNKQCLFWYVDWADTGWEVLKSGFETDNSGWKVYIKWDNTNNQYIERDWETIEFSETHPSQEADTFKIILGGSWSDISYFDRVIIKYNGYLKFFGYVEKIKKTRIGEKGTICTVSGRCRKVILWKKWTERFVENRLTGFFGNVYAIPLLEFLLRCPKSDAISGSVLRHRIGWGIAPTAWSCSASTTDNTTHPDYVKARYTGFAWKKGANQANGDWFKIDLGSSYTRICGILIESRKSSDKYARYYKIQISTDDTNWTDVYWYPVSPNSSRDIIASWRPQTARYIRILLVGGATYDWEISQIYIYQADDADYTILEADEHLGIGNMQWIHGNPIDPINIPFTRVINAIEEVSKHFHDTYTPIEWWVDKFNGEVNFRKRRGVDKSSSISFVTGTHVGGYEYIGQTRGTAQRLRVIGKAEGRKQDETSSNWYKDDTAIASAGTFYEEVISVKMAADSSEADTLAQIFLEERKDIIYEISVTVEKDNNVLGGWQVGDEVLLSDSKLGLSGAYRIRKAEYSIDENGTVLTLTVTNSWKEITEKIADLVRKLQEIRGSGTSIEDWFGEGANQNKIRGSEIDDLWNITVNYKEEDVLAETESAFYSDVANGGPDANGQEWDVEKDMFWIRGVNVESVSDGFYIRIDNISTNWSNNPRFIVECEIPSGSDAWETDDNCYLIMDAVGAGTTYFGFQIYKTATNYELRAVSFDGTTTESIVLTNMSVGTKYRIEARVDWDAKMIRYFLDGVETAIVILASGALNEALYVMAINFTTSNGAGVTTQSELKFYSWKSQYER